MDTDDTAADASFPGVEQEENPFASLSVAEQMDIRAILGWLQAKHTVQWRRSIYLSRLVRTLIHGGGYCHTERRVLGQGEGLPELQHLKGAVTILPVVSKKPMVQKGRLRFVGLETAKETALLGWDRHGAATDALPEAIGPRQIGAPPDVFLKASRDFFTNLIPPRQEAEVFDALRLIAFKGEELQLLQHWEIGARDIQVNSETVRLYGEHAADFHQAAAAVQPHLQAPLFDFDTMDKEQRRSVGYRMVVEYMREANLKFYRPEDGAILDGDGTVVGTVTHEDDEEA